VRALADSKVGACLVLGAALAIPPAAVAQSLAPAGFVYLRDVDGTIPQDIRYAGVHNFTGRPVTGYDAAECVLTKAAALALKGAQQALAARGLSLLVWDCYRPLRAVTAFMQWIAAGDARMKAEFYPATEKRDLVPRGYVATRSAHSRGSTVDVGLAPAGIGHVPAWDPAQPLQPCTAPKGVRFEDGTVDLGTGFDCFDERARFAHSGVGATARSNRALLREIMVRHGFRPYEGEWWHFRLGAEPYPHGAFDFAITKRVSRDQAIPGQAPGRMP
jgi:zinc D-Ala-D-Ala dipeptidase